MALSEREKEVLTSCRENRFQLVLSQIAYGLAIIYGDTLIAALR
jgi:hypothetical protein